jgi:hypothetical protein
MLSFGDWPAEDQEWWQQALKPADRFEESSLASPAARSGIIFWEMVRILPAPPRTPIRTECSEDSSNSPPIGGSRASVSSLEQSNWFWRAFSPLLSLAFADPFLARH